MPTEEHNDNMESIITDIMKLVEEGHFVAPGSTSTDGLFHFIRPELPIDIQKRRRAAYRDGLLALCRTRTAKEIVENLIKEIREELREQQKYLDNLLDMIGLPNLEEQKWFIEYCISETKKRQNFLQDHISRYERLMASAHLTKAKIGQRYTDEDVERVRFELDPSFLIGQPKSKFGWQWKYLCPFHNEKSPSFVWYNTGKRHGHCFGCSYHGSLIDMYMKLNGSNFVNTMIELKKLL